MGIIVWRTILSLILALIPINGFAAEQWTVAKPLASDNPANYPADALANNDSLDRVLANYSQGMNLIYASASTLTVTAGSGTCADVSNVHYFRQTTSSSTLTTSNLDTGSSFSNSTTYYVYENCSANATTATFTISLNASTPSGATAYRLLGNFTTDSSGNIAQIIDNAVPSHLGAWSSVSAGSAHQATTDGFVIAVANTGGSNGHYAYLYVDSSPSPGTLRSEVGSDSSVSGPNGVIGTLFSPVRKGDYYEVTTSGASITNGPYFIPLGQ